MLRDELQSGMGGVASPFGSLESIFSEEPVSLDVFVRDKKFLGNPPLSPIQYEAVQHVERIYYTDLYPRMALEFESEYWANPVRMINYAVYFWAKGSGKDFCARLVSLRIAYLLLCLKSPKVYFGMPETESIHLLNVARSSGQAQRAFFKPMVDALKHSPWFKDRCEPKQFEIVYDNQITAISGHSDAESQEGLNLILGVADEVDAFRTVSEFRARKEAREPSATSEAIIKMLKGSSSTRFSKTFKNVYISYPRYEGSKIMQLHTEATIDLVEKGNKSIYYASGPHKTWEVNPRFFDTAMVSIPQADVPIPNDPVIIDAYEKNAAEARGIYECRPSYAVNLYFKNTAAIRECMSDDPALTQAITVDYTLVSFFSKVTKETTVIWDPVYTFHPEFKPVEGALYCLHVDLAVNGDRAGMAMSHVVSYETVTLETIDEHGTKDEMTYRKPIVKTDFVIAYEADLSVAPQREIQIRWASILIMELKRKGFHIALATWDNFQSVESIQTLAMHGIKSGKLSVDRDDTAWKTLRDVMYESRLKMPYSALLFRELAGLGDYHGKIDHASDSSKDLADGLSGSVFNAIEIGGAEEGSDDGDYHYTPSNDPTDSSDSQLGFVYNEQLFNEPPNLFTSRNSTDNMF